MKSKKTLMDRRQFLIAAGATSTAALTYKKLGGIAAPVFQAKPATASETSGNSVEKKTVDLLVIGGGGGGMTAAVKGVEYGSRMVMLLEKTKLLGGASLVASGISSVNCKVQRESGNSKRLADELFYTMMDATKWINNPKLMRRFVNTTGSFADWIETKKPEMLDFPEDSRVVRFKTVRTLGAAICMLLRDELKKKGVEVLLETRATRLLTDKNGAVVGALASSPDKEYEIQAKSVILSTGSFSRNPEMLKKYFPKYFIDDYEKYYEFEGGETLGRFADGDGIIMAQAIGSMPPSEMDVMMAGTSHHGSPGNRSRSMGTTRSLGGSEVIRVNKTGKRFMAEDGHANVLTMAHQPTAVTYKVFDSDTLAMLLKERGDRLEAEASASIPGTAPRSNKEVMDRLAEENTFAPDDLGASRIADTLEEIAAFIGADPAVFKAEVERYNSFCDKGHDEDFVKDPKYLSPIRKAPFYAMRETVFWQCTRGGIVINENIEVLSNKGTVIKGLYATGDHASDWFIQGGYVGYTGFTWALVSGYMAAESSNEYMTRIG